MSLFPAYGGGGSGSNRGGRGGRGSRDNRQDRGHHDHSSSRREGEDFYPNPLFGNNRSGSSSTRVPRDPGPGNFQTFTIDDYEDGEVNSPGTSRSSSRQGRDSRGGKGKHKKNKHKEKRKRSRSDSKERYNKRHRSQEPEPDHRDFQYDRGVGNRNDNYGHSQPQYNYGGGQGLSMGIGFDQEYGGYNQRSRHGHGGSSQQWGGAGNYGNQHQRDRGGARDWNSDNRRGSNSRQNPNQGGHSRQEQDRRGYQAEDKGRDQYYEDQRITMSQRFPERVFLEQVNLKPEFAFRLDTEPTKKFLHYHALSNAHKSFFQPQGTKVVGASDQELTAIYNKFSKFRCIYPEGIDSSSEDEDGVSKTKVGRKSACDTLPFISLNKDVTDDSESIQTGFESLSFPRKDGGPSMKEQIESFNRRVREEPKNVELWKEFVIFQDKVFEANQSLYDHADEDGGHGQKKKASKKRSKKALTEKKIAILERALETNSRCLALHEMRLDFLSEIHKPAHVLEEWKKLINSNQQFPQFWTEYFKFSVTQLELFTSAVMFEAFAKAFKKFRLMLNPSFPAPQRPLKYHLVTSDILLAFGLALKNAGFREKSFGLFQAQLEMDFNAPKDISGGLKDPSLLTWTKDKELFESFWNSGTPRFGESDAISWSSYLKEESKISSMKFGVPAEAVPDSKVSEFEDSFVAALNEKRKHDSSEGSLEKAKHWLTIESSRSKLQWLPWCSKLSDVDEAEDQSRIVKFSDVSPYSSPVPVVPFITEFDRNAAYFRHILSAILILQEDFIPLTQTVTAILTPFTSLSLTESRSLESEVFYWRRLLNLYAPPVGPSEPEKDNDKPVFKGPEGFQVIDLTTCSTFGLESSTKPCGVLNPSSVYTSSSTLSDLQSKNQSHKSSMLQSLVSQGISNLSDPFAIILFQMFLRYEQKSSIFHENVDFKSRIKNAKNMMKAPQVRNSLSAFGEMAMLEYYQGNRANAVKLLIKTVNIGSNQLQSSNFLDLSAETIDWNSLCDLIKLYTRVAELYLVKSPLISYNVLTHLGSNFQSLPVNLASLDVPVKTNAMLKALRTFEKLYAQLLPGVETESGSEDEILKLSPDMLERYDGDKCVEFLAQKSNLIVELTKAFALFQYLAKNNDFNAGSMIYEKALKRIESIEPLGRSGCYDSDVIIRHMIREQLYVAWCNLGAHILSKDPMANAGFRALLGQALEQYPSSPPLLLLFTDVENQMSIAGKLWRMMVGLVKQDGGCNHWAPLLMGIGLAKKIEDLEHDEEIGLDSFGLGGPAVPPDTIFYKLDSLLTAAQQNKATRNCPLIWRIHLKLLALRIQQGKDTQRAKATFYESIRNCPSSKALYLDGINYFPEILKEITDLMTEKQIYVRLSLEELELLLEIQEEANANNNHTNETVDIASSSEDEDKSDGEV